ncbi:MAG: hypothetical protein KC613_11385 [Myxococcales bacterium]|nr:hypothetical protein [Myxococcales bacterium]
MRPSRLMFAALALCSVSPALARDGEGFTDTRELLGEGVDQNPDLGWQTGLFGYVRAAYEWVKADPNYEFVGRNDGFIIQHARVGFEGWNNKHGLRYRIAIEGASDLPNQINTPQAEIAVRLRDAFVRYAPSKFIGFQMGQFKAPFAEEELRGSMNLMFSDRAVGIQGVAVGRGFQQAGLEVDRQVGFMIMAPETIKIAGDVGLRYYLMLANGNGPNQTLDDNGEAAFIGRLEFSYGDYVLLGGAVMMNNRTEGTLPNLVEEKDLSIAADLLVTVSGFEFFTQLVQRTTEFETVGATPERKQLAWHAQVGYEIPLAVPVVPAYRFAYFDPWASGASADIGAGLDSLALMHHTMGLRVIYPDRSLGLSLYLNYTLTQEEETRELENDRFEALVQLIF